MSNKGLLCQLACCNVFKGSSVMPLHVMKVHGIEGLPYFFLVVALHKGWTLPCLSVDKGYSSKSLMTGVNGLNISVVYPSV